MFLRVCLVICLIVGGAATAGARSAYEVALELAGENAPEIKEFVEAAGSDHGEFGARAARFLVEEMPPRDLRSLDKAFLQENLDLAMKARQQFSWARDVPEEIFLNDVLPYASLDESREMWRRDFFRKCGELVKGSSSAVEAVQVINKEFFNLIGVHYDTGRKAPNQSPSESIELGKATCTGLSIILVDACRSVGVPARIAGTALWTNKRGNHTWVEIYDGNQWMFTGADEYDKKGLNRGWFKADASRAVADDWRHAIWATSWKKTGRHFPMVWNLKDRSVPAVNATSRYVRDGESRGGEATVFIRLWDRPGGSRLALPVDLLDESGATLRTVTTRAGTSDLNDMAEIKIKTGVRYWLRVEQDGREIKEELLLVQAGSVTRDLAFEEPNQEGVDFPAVKQWLALLPEERHLSIPEIALSKEDAVTVAGLVWSTIREELAAKYRQELENKVVKVGERQMKYHERVFGEAADGERSLWISMHGGGGAPPRVNERQWHNQIRLYKPEEGIVVAPRAPTDTWDLWHQAHIDDLFDHLIESFVAVRGVDPDRVYLLGYSAGGDGVYQLAPRMADRFAAAAMMAGHPNDAKPLGLHNLPFMIFMGGNDGAFDRNKVAAQWGEKLEELKKDDGGYEHKVTIYEGLGHWMNGRDREAIPWMAAHSRKSWPAKLIWHQSKRTHDRFYWLSVPAGTAKAGQTVRAEVDDQTIRIEAGGMNQLALRLSDQLVDLDLPILVEVNGNKVFEGKVRRTVRAIWDSLEQRADPKMVATAILSLEF